MKIILPLILAMAVMPAHAQLYKWTDANGKVHYSDRPQDGANATAVTAPRPAAAAPGPAAAPASGDNWRERERASRERLVKTQQEERRAAAAEAQKAAREPYNPSMNKSDKPMSDDEVCTRDAQQIAYSEKAKRLAFNRSGGSAVASEEETREIVRQRKENHALLCGPNQRRR